MHAQQAGKGKENESVITKRLFNFNLCIAGS